MKKIFTIAIILVVLITNAQVPSYVPNNGLVAYYPFNGNANDESGNGNNGTVNGAALTNDRFGNANSAYSFSNNYISLSQAFFNGSTNVNSLTYSVWFKCSQLPSSSNAYSLSNKEGYWRSIGLGINSSGLVSYGGSQPNPQSYFGVTSQNAIILNQWNQVIVTFDNSTLKLYLNGNLENTSVINYSTLDYSYLAIGNSTSTNLIGAAYPVSPGLTNFTIGIIDDFGVWNRALTQQEITNLYNASLPQTACLPANVPTNGLVGYWPFCGNANDESGNGNNGTVNGAVLSMDRNGNINSAYSFDGINDNIGLGNFFNFSTFSISMWVKPGNQNGHAVIIDNNHSSSNNWVFQTISNFSNNGYNFQNSNEVLLSINNWSHLILSYSEGFVRVYLNGNLVSVTQFALNYNNSPSLFLGYWQAANARFWKGDLDDIGIWNRALSQEEITNLYDTNPCITNITVTDTLIINVGQLSFNEPVTWANNITIFPNPASTQININFNNITNLNGGTLKIINSLGQQVATTPITTSGTNSTMQLATWGGSGMYFVQIINSQGQIVDIKKIILQ